MNNDGKLNRNIRRRIGTLLLSLIVAVTMMPVFVFAEDIPAQEAAAETVTVEEAGDLTGDKTGDLNKDTESADEEAAAQTDDAADEEAALQADASDEEVSQPADGDGQPQTIAITPGSEEADAAGGTAVETDEEVLLDQFLEEKTEEQIAANDGAQTDTRTIRGDRLRGNDRLYYDELVKGIDEIVEGNCTMAVVDVDLKKIMGDKLSYTAEELGVDSIRVEGQVSPVAKQVFREKFRCSANNIYKALLYDMPYKLYWHDKTIESGPMNISYVSGVTGDSISFYANKTSMYFKEAQQPTVRFKFMVSAGYNPSGLTGTTALDTDKIRMASGAAQEAADLITKNSTKTDLDKLTNYRDYICANNVYNRDAVEKDVIYGDPWQMIYIFDNDLSTNVVCEGYSKAFKFLCDHTDFKSSLIECYIATGLMDFGSNKTGRDIPSITDGAHMWNIIRMNDGRYYMADITNCDGKGGFAPDKLFLKGSALPGTTEEGYRFEAPTMYTDTKAYAIYRYDEDTLSMYSYELELSNYDYNGADGTDESQIAAAIQQKKEAQEALDDAKASEEYKARREAAQAVENAIIEAARQAAEEAARRAAEEAAKARVHVHTYQEVNTLDSVTYRCTGCGYSYTRSKVVVDLPRVTIRKPLRAKRSITVRWKKVSKKNRRKIKGIEIQYSTKKSFASSYTIRTAKKTAVSKRFKKLARRKYYYVRIRSYKWINGTKHVSKWSAVRKVKTK